MFDNKAIVGVLCDMNEADLSLIVGRFMTSGVVRRNDCHIDRPWPPGAAYWRSSFFRVKRSSHVTDKRIDHAVLLSYVIISTIWRGLHYTKRKMRGYDKTRKPSCRWQTRATPAKSLHGLRKSSGVVVSCIGSLLIDSVPMVYYYVLYSNCVCKMRRFEDTRLLKLPWPWNPGQGHSRSSELTPFDSLHMVSYYRPIVTLCL